MKLVILDRDGTINIDRDDYVKSADEWLPLPGSLEAIAKLNTAGYTVAVATNQSGVGRGFYSLATLDAMHAKMNTLLAVAGGRVDKVFFCPHHPDVVCDCRKPRPGLFTQIGAHYGVDLTTVHTVGDTLRDLQAGLAVGCIPHLVRTGKAEHKVPDGLPSGTRIHLDLNAFADWLIAKQSSGDSHLP